MSDIITDRDVERYERLFERLLYLQNTVASTARMAPSLPAGHQHCFAVSSLLREVRRLLSREPGADLLPKLSGLQQPSLPELAALLREAQVALETYKYDHEDHRGMFGGGWLTRECFLERAADEGLILPTK